VHKAQLIDAPSMKAAVERVAGVKVLHLHGMVNLSSKSNPVEWIDSDGNARQFTAYEIYIEV
jgi:hypothetical protein